MKFLRRFEFIAVALALIIGFAVRTYRLDAPLADWHSWRQADTAAVARNFVKHKFDLLYPQSDSLLALNEYNLPNPNRYFINEFPLYNAIVAQVYRQFGIDVMYARLVSIFFALFGSLFLYLLTKELLGRKIALITMLVYLFNPFNIYYSRVVMPDPTFVAFAISSLYFAVRYTASNKLSFGLLAAVSFALSTLVKPYGIFIGIPIVYWFVYNRGLRELITFRNLLLLVFASAPLILWRYHVFQHKEGSFASTWLLNGDGIRFKGSFFRWLIFDRLNRLIFATGGFVLFVIGFLDSHTNRAKSLFFVWTLAIFTYFTVFAKGNVNHDYYQLPIVAPGSALIAIGIMSILNKSKSFINYSINLAIIVSLIALSLAFGWYEVRGFFNINNPAIVEAGLKVDELVEEDALVIADYQGDPAFLYQTNRHGWPIGGDVEAKIDEGAKYYVTTSRNDDYHRLSSKYELLYETPEYSIIDLTKSK